MQIINLTSLLVNLLPPQSEWTKHIQHQFPATVVYFFEIQQALKESDFQFYPNPFATFFRFAGSAEIDHYKLPGTLGK